MDLLVTASCLIKVYPSLCVLSIPSHSSKCFTCIILFNPTLDYEVDSVMSILQVRKLKHTEFK